MNSRTNVFDLTIERRQAEECLSTIFHTILFQRSMCKVLYKTAGTFAYGAIGYEDRDCEYADFTYVRCSSPSLISAVTKEVKNFAEELKKYPEVERSQMTLQFVEKKPARMWGHEVYCWEEWNVNLKFVSFDNERDRQISKEHVGNQLSSCVFEVTELINTEAYVPPMPKDEAALQCVFDMTYEDVMPYLFHFKTVLDLADAPGLASGLSIGRLFRGTLLY